MKAATDMEKVLAVAKDYFDKDVEVRTTSSGNEYIFHPFLDRRDFSLCVPRIDDRSYRFSEVLENPEQSQRLKEDKWKRLCELPAAELIASAQYDYPFRIFRDTVDFLSVDDFSLALQAIWPYSNQGLEPSAACECTKNEVISWFSSCNPQKLMTPTDLSLFTLLPDVITVYRGEDGPESIDPAGAVSWTLNPEAALERSGDSHFGAFYNGAGYKASIKKEDVLAYFYHHSMMEIVLNPDKLFDVKYIVSMEELLMRSEIYEMVFKMDYWHDRYFNAEIYCRLNEKLEPLGRASELIEAAMDVKKFEKLVSEFPVGTVIV